MRKNQINIILKNYGTIYRNSISNVLQKLGVDSKRHNRFTELIFNQKKIMKNSSQYNISIQHTNTNKV